MPPLALNKVVGIFKSYQTRVGAGGMPTELDNELGEHIRTRGHEFGTTTGRPRRVGFFDGVAALYAHRINGFTDIAVTRIDTLADVKELKIATGYKDTAGWPTDFPTDNTRLSDCIPAYESYEGWTEAEIAKASTFDELPLSAKAYCEAIVTSMPGAKLSFVGVGQARNQLLVI